MDRRSFLKTGALGTIGLALGGQDGSTPEDVLRATHAVAWYGR